MKRHYYVSKLVVFSLLFVLSLVSHTTVNACTRALYVGDDGLVITGRNMDWFEEMQTELWVFPRGMKRDGGVGPKSVKWTSKYGSLAVSVYNVGTTEGANEKGLVVNLLYLAGSDYGESTNRKQISVGAYAQYILDNFATVSEAVEGLKDDELQIIAPDIVGRKSTVHFAISDPSGDSAILEFINGKLVIHHSKEFKTMTNEPTYEKQLALNTYWKEIGGAVMLPGTYRPADRFVRADYYINAIPKTSDAREGVAAVRSVMCEVSVPRGIKDPSKPNVSTTIWRSVFDHKNMVYYYEPTSSPYIFWVSLKKLNFTKGAPVMKLELENGKRILGGEAADKFEKAKPFKWLAPKNQ